MYAVHSLSSTRADEVKQYMIDIIKKEHPIRMLFCDRLNSIELRNS